MADARIEELLAQIDTAQEEQDWARVESLAGQVLALEPANVDALSYQTIAVRRGSRAAADLPAQPMADLLQTPAAVRSASAQLSALHAQLPLVGRDAELEILAQLLSPNRVGRLVLIGGGPGVGKTRLAEEFSSLATDRGATVIWGRCQDDAGAPPYWPWTEAFRVLAKAGDAELAALEGQLSSPAAESDMPARDPDAARFQLYDHAATVLDTAAARAGTLVVVLDDLQWADQASLGLLRFVGLHTELAHTVVVGTYRNVDLGRRHPLTRTLAELRRQDRVLWQRIGSLSSDDVAVIIAAVAGAPPPKELVDAVHRQTDGNAFFVNEVVRALADSGALAPASWAGVSRWQLQVPEGIREAIGARLDQLPPAAADLLSLAAVLGQEFRAAELDAAAAASESPPSASLRPAVHAGLAAEQAGSPGVFRFTHPLIREALLAELTPSERASMHADIARALERLHKGDENRYAAALAIHFSGAVAVLGSAQAARYALLAGQEALAKYAYADAKQHFERGLSVHGRRGEERDDPQTAELLFGLGLCQYALRDSPDAAATVTRAYHLFERAGRRRSAVAVAAHPFLRYVDGALFERALQIAPRGSLETARIICNLVGSNPTNVDHADAEERLTRALEIAIRHHDAPLQQRVLSVWLHADFWADELASAAQRISRVEELMRGTEDPGTQAESLYILSVVLRAQGELARAAALGQAAVEAAERLRHERWLRLTYSHMFAISHCLGDWEQALQWGDKELQYINPVTPNIARRVAVETELGHREAAERLLSRLTAPGEHSGHRNAVALTTAFVARITGDHSRLHVVEQAAREAEAGDPPPTIRRRSGAARAMLAVVRGDRAAARRLLPEQVRWQALVPDAYVNLVTPRLLGLLATTAGELEAAVGWFERALKACRRSGSRPELAWTNADYAEMLLDAGSAATSARKPEALLRDARTLSVQLGMTPLQQRITGLAARQAAPGPGAGSGTVAEERFGLTPRELEVLTLLSGGKTNKEIGAALGITVKTTENHIARIFAKIGVGNRTEAAGLAKQQGLVNAPEVTATGPRRSDL